MDLIRTYKNGGLYDAQDDIMRLLRKVTSKFTEGTFEFESHVAYICCTYSGSAFPWLFYSELDKAVRLWCAEKGIPNTSLAATEVSNTVCFINRHIRLTKD